MKTHYWGNFTKGLYQVKAVSLETVILAGTNGHTTEGPGFIVCAVTDGRRVTSGHGVFLGLPGLP